MNAIPHPAPDRERIERARSALAEKPDGLVETIARDAAVSPRDVLEALPAGEAVFVGADRFLDVWASLAAWREVLVIVQAGTVVIEVRGPLPVGTDGHGWYNIHGDSPIGGHIKYENCAGIAFVARPFMGRQSRSVQFFNADGGAMFKVFVRRDAERNLLPEQVERFDALRQRLKA
jgi:putative heme utilization carrier protein HutX